MKRFFFFRSSSPNAESNKRSPPKTSSSVGDKSENSFRSPKSSKIRRQVLDAQPSDSPCFRRSVSSSAALHRFPPDGNNNLNKPSNRRSSRCRTPTPERQSKCFDSAVAEHAYVVNALGLGEFSESSSFSSNNVSSIVLDRYIDGEQDFSLQKQGNYDNREDFVKRPPKVQYTAPTSPTNSMREKPKSLSFRDPSSRAWVENSFGHESPRSLAKHVIERLSQSRALGKTSSDELDLGNPITIDDVYGASFKKSPNSDEMSYYLKKNCPERDIFAAVKSDKSVDDLDVDLMRKSKEAQERIWSFSEEHEKENFLEGNGFNVPALVQTIRNLLEERLNMAHEVAAALESRIAERDLARKEVKLLKEELDSRTQRLEKEKTELQSSLEHEIDRRSSDWSLKLEKYQAEEHRLRERVRELAEQNVSLQRDVSSLSEREMENRSKVVDSESQLKDVSLRMEEVSEENQNLSENLSVLKEKCREVEEEQKLVKRNYDDKEKECKDLHKSISRMLRTCSEQESTIDGLRKALSEAIGKMGSNRDYEKHLAKLQMEQLRLTGVEQNLRKEIESYRVEIDTLRHENVNLLHRLKANGEGGGFSTHKLDQELLDRVNSIQTEGLLLLEESNKLCKKLVDYAKVKAIHGLDTKHVESLQNGLNGQFVMESEMEVQSIKRRAESLSNSLKTIASVFDSKSKPGGEQNLHCFEDRKRQFVDQNPEDAIRSELKAETLLTSVLREKLFAKEVHVEQMQAELAAAVRGNDMLRNEVQNAMDNLSCMTHKMKDLELQMIKKDENINRLEDDLEECRKESTFVRGILPKISEERDMLWKDVKQYSERNMLMNSEINMLKKKIEALDEDILLKEGQITILKDTLGKPFDLLASPESVPNFQLEL